MIPLGKTLPGVIEHMATINPGAAPRFNNNRRGERPVIPKVVRRLVWWRDAGQCQLCGTRRVRTELDHIVPWSAGGRDDSTNLRVLCGPCNQRRSNYRTVPPMPVMPVVMCCDPCLLHEHERGRRCRYWPACETCGNTPRQAEPTDVFCGVCRTRSSTRDRRRLL